jgi:hypothetical protein
MIIDVFPSIDGVWRMITQTEREALDEILLKHVQQAMGESFSQHVDEIYRKYFYGDEK